MVEAKENVLYKENCKGTKKKRKTYINEWMKGIKEKEKYKLDDRENGKRRILTEMDFNIPVNLIFLPVHNSAIERASSPIEP